MQRGERCQTAEFSNHLWRHHGWASKFCSAMDHTMSDAYYLTVAIYRLEPYSQRIQRPAAVTHIRGFLIHKCPALAVLCEDPRRRPDALDLTARFKMPRARRRSTENTELKAR